MRPGFCTPRQGSRGPLMTDVRRAAAFGALLLIAFAFTACGEDSGGGGAGELDANAGHVHGLGINPADGSLFIATHAGLFRSAPGSGTAAQVGDSTQDTMGFGIVGPDRFVGSGHPGPGEGGPSSLGLIESPDAGRSWEGISLSGEADFHILRSSADRIYGFNGLSGLFMVSADGGETWDSRQPPGGLIDVAVDPEDSSRVLAASDLGLIESGDEGENWDRRSEAIGYLAWPTRDRLYLFDGEAAVSLSRDGGATFTKVGGLPEVPVAVLAGSATELYAALSDGEVLMSRDGGRTWSRRVAPLVS